MFSFTTTAKTAVAGVAIAAAVALPLLAAPAAFAGDAYFAPTAVDDEYWMTQGTTLQVIDGGVGVILNDFASDSGDLRIDAMNSPFNNEILGLSSLGYFDFTPDPSFVGDRVITYTIKDTLSGLSSNTATIVIHIAAAPAPAAVTNPDNYTTPQDTTLVVDVASGVLANDSNVVQVSTQDNTVGTLAINAAGDFTYTPPAGFVGTVTFNYSGKAADSTLTNAALVTIEVTPATISVIPTIPVTGGGDPGDNGDSDGQLETLAYTGTDDVTVWLIAPALALLAAGGAAIWFTRRRTNTTTTN